MTHLSAEQWGVGAINGDNKKPYADADVQKYVYKWGDI